MDRIVADVPSGPELSSLSRGEQLTIIVAVISSKPMLDHAKPPKRLSSRHLRRDANDTGTGQTVNNRRLSLRP